MPRVKVEHTKPMTVAYIEHQGPYDEIPFPTYVERLYGWAKRNRIRPGFHPLAIYYDLPAGMPRENLRSEIAIPVYGRPKSEGEVKVRRLRAMNVATISHKGPSREYPNTYRFLSEWVDTHGYRWAGPAIEVYSKKPEVKDGETIVFAKIEAPITKKK
jgi:effector-binding domain-containing protein